MSCYHPLKGWPIGVTENGRPDYKVTSYDVVRIDVVPASSTVLPPRLVYVTEDMIKAGYTVTPGSTEQKSYFVELPCGKCIGCRLRYSRQWADRLMLELQYHEHAWFVTCTYDDDHVPRMPRGSCDVNPATGEIVDGHLSLVKRDWQLFMKRLRKECEPDKLRFYAAGEYGELTFRPHYHAIIFGWNIAAEDMEFYKRDLSGKFNYYKLPRISNEVWKKGFVVVGKVTWESCAYTARYIMKKLKGPASELYTDMNIEPPFCLMSRKPGIARQYYEDHPDLFKFENINISTDNGGRKLQIPRYYDKLLEVENPDLAADRKERRQRIAQLTKERQLAQSDLDYLGLLRVQEEAKLGSIKKLKREL